MHITGTEAKDRFGSVCAQAERELVLVEKAGLVDTVILSAEHYQALQAAKTQSTLSAGKAAFNADTETGSGRKMPWWNLRALPARTCALGEPGAEPMAQYDVYPNPSASADQGIPYGWWSRAICLTPSPPV